MLLPLLGVVSWFLLKVFQFQINQEQYGDGLVVLQLSKGWLEGRPALFDTIYGNHALQHNYYFILLVGFLTKPLGVYGLFVAYLSLVGIFFMKWYGGFKDFGIVVWANPWLTVFFFFFGPMAYYIYLDYFGWHVEQFFIPLLALLSLGTAMRKWLLAICMLVLLFSVKETSPVLICSLLLFCSVVDHVLNNSSKHYAKYIFSSRNLIIVAVCFIFFCLGLWWLSHLNDSQSTRLKYAFARTHFSKELLYYIVISFLIALLTFGIGIIPFIPWLRIAPRRILVTSSLFFCYLILFLVYSIEGLFYLPVFYPGISYPARIGGLWGLLLSAFVFLIYRLTQLERLPDCNANTWLLSGVLLQFVFSPFLVAHFFSVDSKPRNLLASATYLVNTKLGLNPYPDGTANQLHNLAQKLPEGSEVIVPYKFMSYFQNVYPSPWNFDDDPFYIFGKPLLYIYQKELIDKEVYLKFPGNDFKTIPNEHLLILAEPNWYKQNFK